MNSDDTRLRLKTSSSARGEARSEFQTEPKLRTILKFDSGLKGFDRMIWVLALTALGVLALGVYFFLHIFPRMLP